MFNRARGKKYKIDNPKFCEKNRILGCYRAGIVFQRLEVDRAEIKSASYLKIACDAGLKNACTAIDKSDDRWWLILYTAIAGVGLAVFIFVSMLFKEQSEMQATEQLEEGEADKKDEVAKYGVILKYSRPFFKFYLSPMVSGMKIKRQIKEKYKQPIASAGLGNIMTPEDFFAFKLFLIIGFPIVFLAVRTFMEETCH